ncbi:TPA: hypothetical protein WI060_001053 [Neisseria meningitidis]
MPSESLSDGIFIFRTAQASVRRRQLLHEFAAAFAPPKRKKLYQLLHEFIPV